MNVNGNKFQLIIFNRQMQKNMSTHVDDQTILWLNCWVYILMTYLTNFDAHVDSIVVRLEGS